MMRFTPKRASEAVGNVPQTGDGPPSPPTHIAIIMDGNGRWASKRGLPRIAGHKRGINAVRKVTREAKAQGVRYLTLFAFSTENWLRPKEEVHGLFDLFRYYMRRECRTLAREGVRIRFIGDAPDLPDDLQRMMDEAETLTSKGDTLTLVIALNYGSRAEIATAAQRLAQQAVAGDIALEDITDEALGREMMTSEFPDPDLLIRTSGEQRLSNFLLWQAAYSEFLFVDKHWPDFDEAAFREAIELYHQRDRRFGRVKTAS